MKRKNLKYSLLVALSVCIILCTIPGQSYGELLNKGINLPGTVSSSDGTKYAITYSGGAIVNIGLVAPIASASSPNKAGNFSSLLPEWNSNRGNLYLSTYKPVNNYSNYQLTTTSTLIQQIEQAAHRLPFELYANPVSMSSTFVFKATKGVEVGLKIRF